MSSAHASEPARRDIFVDFVRGIVIVDMLLVHYRPYFPEILRQAVSYSDVAMEGFLLLSGYMTGRHYLKRYRSNPPGTTTALWRRSAKLLVVQFILILTVSVPHFALVHPAAGGSALQQFVIDSMLFRNQVGLLHILPLFIALSMLNPGLLWLSSRGWGVVLAAASVLAFWAGRSGFTAFDYGEAPIFPILLWQLYYVIGYGIGTRERRDQPAFAFVTPGIVAGMFLIGLLLKHGSGVIPALPDPTKFPLSAAGVWWGLSLVAMIVVTARWLWPFLSTTSVARIIALYGRNSLLFFAIHVYFAKTLVVLAVRVSPGTIMWWPVIALNFIAAAYVLRLFERPAATNSRGPVRQMKLLFG